jgi:hypothetical protein
MMLRKTVPVAPESLWTVPAQVLGENGRRPDGVNPLRAENECEKCRATERQSKRN